MSKSTRKSIEAEIVIVGSGAGGATVAKELGEHGKTVLILEKGSKLGQLEPSLVKRIYKRYNEGTLVSGIYRKLRRLMLIDRNLPITRMIGIGGTTTIANANAARSLEKELGSLGVNIENELQEIEQELKVGPIPQNHMGTGANSLWEAAHFLGLKFEPIHKFIDYDKCASCDKCIVKCPTNAKWTAVNFIRKAEDNGASLLTNVAVKEVVTSNGSVVGVKTMSPDGEMFIRANIVVLAAGAIETPIILQKTGIDSAGKKLFCDTCYFVYGPSKTDIFDRHPALIDFEFLRKDGFLLIQGIYDQERTLCMSLKIKDDPIGGVRTDGSIRKTMTSNDLSKLNKALPICKEILVKAGVDHRYIKIKGVGGHHPGGTAAIGEVVDQHQETEVKNLFVSDASVLPTSAALPPLLTIMALSKRLAKRLSLIT